jgi:hypothetical protein
MNYEGIKATHRVYKQPMLKTSTKCLGYVGMLFENFHGGNSILASENHASFIV